MAPLWGGCLRTTFALMCPDRPLGLSEQVLEAEAEEFESRSAPSPVTLLLRAPASAVTGGQRPPVGQV